MITVEHKAKGTYLVTVELSTTTQHEVTLTEEYYTRLTSGKVEPEELIEKSFEFLLKREGNTMILRSFDLPIIGSYFPEYEKTLAATLSDA